MIELDENGNIPAPPTLGVVYRLEDNFQEGYNYISAATVEELEKKKDMVKKYTTFRDWVFVGSAVEARVECMRRNKQVVRLSREEVRSKTVTALAKRFFDVETMELQNMDQYTFHEVSGTSIRRALEEAYNCGRDSQ